MSNSSKAGEKKLSLHQKLIEIRKQVDYIQKDAKGYNYSYASESALLGKIRGKMDELNVLLTMDMVSLSSVLGENTTQTKQDGNVSTENVKNSFNGIQVQFQFEWIDADDPSQTIKRNMFLRSEKSDEKTMGSLMTYAHRYFLYKFFSIPTDKDDPDAFNQKVGAPMKFITEQQANYLKSLLSGKDKKLEERLFKHLGISDYTQIPSSKYNAVKADVEKVLAHVSN